ncbi:hypothetical protein [Aquimarina sp. I32.4]|uniref:hypothetical protein n=1 Tax=Aquimarina sp. I32.4 TaxID=2053903 RepID=UPI000CDF21DE|nr:hypothetical protein [Aquimarina sp. I32.4]
MDSKQNFNDLNISQQKHVEMFISNRFNNENVPFLEHENAFEFLNEWNPSVLLIDGMIRGFSKEASRTIELMVNDRRNLFRN